MYWTPLRRHSGTKRQNYGYVSCRGVQKGDKWFQTTEFLYHPVHAIGLRLKTMALCVEIRTTVQPVPENSYGITVYRYECGKDARRWMDKYALCKR